MNAAHDHQDARAHRDASSSLQGRLSALVDGELSLEEWTEVLRSGLGSVEMHATWNRYQVIGDVLRGGAPATAVRPPSEFLADLRMRLPSEVATTGAGRSAATPQALAGVERKSSEAANDPAFRWKLVAGLASVVAVVAVSWQLAGTALAPAGGDGGPQLALMAPAGNTDRATLQSGTSQPVLVTTQQGTVIRDARLEELLAAHRQVGGTSALQMPAGFLRNATYDAPTR